MPLQHAKNQLLKTHGEAQLLQEMQFSSLPTPVLVVVYFLLQICSCLWVGRVLVYYWFFFPALKTNKKLGF
jgi:hypothetical protein